MLDGDAAPADMAAPFGLKASTAQRPHAGRLKFRPQLTLADVRACHATALAALAVLVHRLDPALWSQVEHWIAPAEAQAAHDLAAHVQVRALGPALGLLRRTAMRLKLIAV